MKHNTELNPLTLKQRLQLAAEFIWRGVTQERALEIVNSDINEIMDMCYRMTGRPLISIVGPREN